MGDEQATYLLLSDVPTTTGPDPLGFDTIAAGLARGMVASRDSTPLTLGIEGEWGSGKSSLMQRLGAHLDQADDVATVWFNAWTAERSSALEGLVKTVLAELDPNVLRRSLRSQRLLRLGRTLSVDQLGGGFGKPYDQPFIQTTQARKQFGYTTGINMGVLAAYRSPWSQQDRVALLAAGILAVGTVAASTCLADYLAGQGHGNNSADPEKPFKVVEGVPRKYVGVDVRAIDECVPEINIANVTDVRIEE